jgi:DNA/RNA endonuclease YhcR with UshA esterase domain
VININPTIFINYNLNSITSGYMEDKKIFKLALFTAIFGLVGMMFSANYVTPQKIQIKEINPGMLDKEVSVEGVVVGVSQSQKGGTYFLDLMDGTGKIKVVIFESAASEIQKTNIKIANFNNRRLNIVGRVNEYQGSLELVLKDASSLKIVV